MTPEDRREEAKRVLRRMDGEAEKILGHGTPDPEPDDRIEILGKRIGRILSIILAVVLIIYLWRTYLAG